MARLFLLILVFLVSAPISSAKRFPASLTVEDQILQIEHSRSDPNDLLPGYARSASFRVAKMALVAMGRIGDPKYLETLTAIIARKDKTHRKTAVFAMSLVASPLSVTVLSQNIALTRDKSFVADLALGLGRTGQEAALPAIARVLQNEQDSAVLVNACRGLGIWLAMVGAKAKLPPEVVDRLAGLAQEDPTAVAASFALARYQGELNQNLVPPLLGAIQKTRFAEARAFLVRKVGSVKNPDVAKMLIRESTAGPHLGTRVEAIKNLSKQEFDDKLKGAYSSILQKENHPAMLSQALDSVGSHGTVAALLSADVLKWYQRGFSLWLKACAVKALARIDPARTRPIVNDILSNPASPLQPDAVAVLGILGSPDDLKTLPTWITHKDSHISQNAILTLMNLPTDKIGDAIKNALKETLLLLDPANVSLAVEVIVRNGWKDFAPTLILIYPKLKGTDAFEARTAIVKGLEALDDKTTLPPAMTASTISIPSYAEVARALQTKVLLKTSKGDIVLRFKEDAPVTTFYFVRLVNAHFYDGLSFHRVVPNFVVQGGDPRGDGYGGPGYFVRDEVTLENHDRGMVGIATAGKDTGGCQIFFDLAPNLHLDGRYTNFAEVTKGQEILDYLEIGDKILSASVIY